MEPPPQKKKKENGNPLQCSCLENPIDGEAWRVTVCRVAKNHKERGRNSSEVTAIASARQDPGVPRGWEPVPEPVPRHLRALTLSHPSGEGAGWPQRPGLCRRVGGGGGW